jgi:alpha-glucosidase
LIPITISTAAEAPNKPLRKQLQIDPLPYDFRRRSNDEWFMTFFINRFLATSTIQAQRLVGAIRYGLQHDRLEAADRDRGQIFQEPISSEPPVVKSTLKGVWIDFHGVRLTIEFKTVNTIEIHWQVADEREFYQAVTRTEWEPVDVEFNPTEVGWELTTEWMRVQIYRDRRLDIYDRQERLVRQEDPPLRIIVDGEPQLERGWRHRSRLQPKEHIYGLGERSQGLNLQGKTADRLANTDPLGKSKPRDPLYLGIPVYIGLHAAGSYLVFHDNPCDGTMEFATDEAIVSFGSGSLRYYVSVGKLPVLLDAYTQLTGRPALPPRWALGYHHCRWSYERESLLGRTFRQIRSPDIPIVAMHLDIDCLADFQPGTIATDRSPTLKEFAEGLAAQGVKTTLILHPCLNLDVGDRFFQQAVANKYFCTNQAGEPIVAPLWAGDRAFGDFTDPDVRKWWSQQYQRLLDRGFSGFWYDPNEPATSTLWGDLTLLDRANYHNFAGSGGTQIAADNLTGLQQAQAGYERLRSTVPDKRPFLLARSGWAGIQQYAWVCTGVVTGWDSLQQTILMVINLGLSGIPFSGPDIGGFLGNPSPELCLRWFQLSCFLPFCRTHGNNKSAPRFPWAFDDRALNAIRAALDLRVALLPYFYTLAWEAHQTGAPLVRPLFWNAIDRPDLWDVQDTFLLGNALLVAPIVTKDCQERQIPLPPSDWYDFWSERSWSERPQITVPVTLDRIPVLVKAGSILPMTAAQRLILHCYPDRSGNCQGTLYSDACDGYAGGRIDRFELVHEDGK